MSAKSTSLCSIALVLTLSALCSCEQSSPSSDAPTTSAPTTTSILAPSKPKTANQKLLDELDAQLARLSEAGQSIRNLCDQWKADGDAVQKELRSELSKLSDEERGAFTAGLRSGEIPQGRRILVVKFRNGLKLERDLAAVRAKLEDVDVMIEESRMKRGQLERRVELEELTNSGKLDEIKDELQALTEEVERSANDVENLSVEDVLKDDPERAKAEDDRILAEYLAKLIGAPTPAPNAKPSAKPNATSSGTPSGKPSPTPDAASNSASVPEPPTEPERPVDEWANAGPGDSKTLTIKEVDWTFHFCPAGSFTMGSPESEEGRNERERQHRVTLTRNFWTLETEVTQAMWKAIEGTNPSKLEGPNHPVETVSWNDCGAFLDKLNQFAPDGWKFRLPTEAEWEYACRAGAQTAFPWGDALNGDKANCNGFRPCGTKKEGTYLGKTTPVGSYEPNAWGLCDMCGNVYEWTDTMECDYPSREETDPNNQKGFLRVVRGGYFAEDAKGCRAAARNSFSPKYSFQNCGLRVVLVPKE